MTLCVCTCVYVCACGHGMHIEVHDVQIWSSRCFCSRLLVTISGQIANDREIIDTGIEFFVCV